MSADVGVLVTALLLFGGTVYASNRRDRHAPIRDLAEAASMTTEAFAHLMEPYREEVESLRRRVEYLEEKLDRLRVRANALSVYASRLRDHLYSVGETPEEWPSGLD